MSAFLETERLSMRPWQASDANRAMAIYGAPSVSPWLVPALSALDTPAGRSLVELLARVSRLALVLADTQTSAEIAPLAPLGEGWVVLGTRRSVRGVDLPTGS